MNIENQKIELDLFKRNSQNCFAIKGDIGTRQLDIYITQKESIFNLTGLQVLFYCQTSQGSKVYSNVTISNAELGKLQVDLPTSLTNFNGTHTCCLVFREGQNQVLSFEFFINVCDSVYDEGAIVASNDFSALTTALNKTEQYNTELQNASKGLETKYTTRLNGLDSQLAEKAKQNDLEVERTRIDNIIKNTGTSVNDIELQDIRIGFNGNVYPSAGTSIREQVRMLNNNLTKEKTITNGEVWSKPLQFRHYWMPIIIKKDCIVNKISFKILQFADRNLYISLCDNNRQQIIETEKMIDTVFIDNITPINVEYIPNYSIKQGLYYLYVKCTDGSFNYENSLYASDEFIEIPKSNLYPSYTNTLGTGGTVQENLVLGFRGKIDYSTTFKNDIEEINNELVIINQKTENVSIVNNISNGQTWSKDISIRHYWMPIIIKNECVINEITCSILMNSNADLYISICDNTRTQIEGTEMLINKTFVNNTTPINIVYTPNINLLKGQYYIYFKSINTPINYNLSNYLEDEFINIPKSSDYPAYINMSGTGGTIIQNSAIGFVGNIKYSTKVKNSIDIINDTIDNIKNNLNLNYTMNYLYVSKTGNDTTGNGTKINPYATIFKANDTIKDNSATNRYTIIVAKGVYTDLQEKYSGTYSGTYEGVVCKNYVFYESEDVTKPELCVIEWNGATGFTGTITDNMVSDKTPFHFSKTNYISKIRGFKFICKNLRYALHLEQNGYAENIIEDCIFEWAGVPDITGVPMTRPTVGMGGSFFQNTTFTRCKFYNSQSTAGIQWHDNDYPTDMYGVKNIYHGANLIFEDCWFDNLDIQVKSTNANRDMPFKLVVKNCGGLRTIYADKRGSATINYWRGHVQNSLVEDDRISNATNTTDDGDLAIVK